MKPVYVLIDKQTGDFWKKENRGFRKGPARTVQAYTSEAKAWAALKQFHPQPDKNNIKVVEYTQ